MTHLPTQALVLRLAAAVVACRAMFPALSHTGTPMAAAALALALAQAQALAATTTQAEAQPLAQAWTTTQAQDLPPAVAATAVAVALPVLFLVPRLIGTSMSGREMTSKVLALARAVAATSAAVVGLALTTTTTMRGATLAVATMVTTMGTTAMNMQEQVLQQVSGYPHSMLAVFVLEVFADTRSCKSCPNTNCKHQTS